MCRFVLLFSFLAFVCPPVFAHPADESGLRVKVELHRVEIRLTFNILTLTRFVKIDSDADGKISIAELDAAQPGLVGYLNRRVLMLINHEDAKLGTEAVFEYLWPDARATAPMAEPEYGARNVDVTFVVPVEGRLLEDVWLGFELFEQTGPMQIIRGAFEKEGEVTEVQFSAQEPEYMYDTGFAADLFVQEAEKKGKAVAAVKPAPTVKPSPSTTQPAAKAEGPSESRWWMLRVVVLIFVIVLGRRATLAKRAARMPTRRERRS